MTEDITFKKLRQIPFSDMLAIYKKLLKETK